MHSRLELHDILVEILGSKYVYFQPPEKVKMNYPCIVYELSKIKSTMADNKRYLNTKRYSITIIDPNPDSSIHEKMLELPYSSFDRFYTYDNLNHWVYTLYF